MLKHTNLSGFNKKAHGLRAYIKFESWGQAASPCSKFIRSKDGSYGFFAANDGGGVSFKLVRINLRTLTVDWVRQFTRTGSLFSFVTSIALMPDESYLFLGLRYTGTNNSEILKLNPSDGTTAAAIQVTNVTISALEASDSRVFIGGLQHAGAPSYGYVGAFYQHDLSFDWDYISSGNFRTSHIALDPTDNKIGCFQRITTGSIGFTEISVGGSVGAMFSATYNISSLAFRLGDYKRGKVAIAGSSVSDVATLCVDVSGTPTVLWTRTSTGMSASRGTDMNILQNNAIASIHQNHLSATFCEHLVLLYSAEGTRQFARLFDSDAIGLSSLSDYGQYHQVFDDRTMVITRYNGASPYDHHIFLLDLDSLPSDIPEGVIGSELTVTETSPDTYINTGYSGLETATTTSTTTATITNSSSSVTATGQFF
jgi:hypothetical protein